MESHGIDTEKGFRYAFAMDPLMTTSLNEWTARDYKLLDEQFQWVKKHVFPEWDNDGEWIAAVFHYPHDTDGKCDMGNRIIWIHNHRLLVDGKGRLLAVKKLRLILIHEICHALCPTTEWHGILWQNQMASAEERLGVLEYDATDEQLYGHHSPHLVDYGDTLSDEEFKEREDELESLLCDMAWGEQWVYYKLDSDDSFKWEHYQRTGKDWR